MLIRLDCQYLKKAFPTVSTLMVPIKEALRETLFPTLFGGEEVDSNLWKILGRSVKIGGLGILEPCMSEDNSYITSTESLRELVG